MKQFACTLLCLLLFVPNAGAKKIRIYNPKGKSAVVRTAERSDTREPAAPAPVRGEIGRAHV